MTATHIIHTQQLSDRGLACCHYHADMTPQVKQEVHDAWSQGAVQVIVATIAFGMVGIWNGWGCLCV